MPVAAEHAAGGPYYLALSTADEPEFGAEHLRYDEYVFSFSLRQEEGDFAILSLEIRNPYSGLYAPGQKIYCWFAKDGQELFRGRMIGIPSSLLGEIITIEFTSRPSDARAQKIALAETMRVLPMYDPVFVDTASLTDPDVVLEGYSELWHYDRTSHLLTSSDIISGDETLIFNSNLYDGVEVTLDGVPRASVDYEAMVTWSQQATGTVNFGQKTFSSYTAGTIAGGWPEPGSGLSGGWSVATGTGVVHDNTERPMVNLQFNYQNHSRTKSDGDVLSIRESKTGPIYNADDISIRLSYEETNVVGDPATGRQASGSIAYTNAIIPAGGVAVTTLVLKYEADRKREERLRLRLNADIQPVLHDEDDETEEPETINGVDVGLPIIESSSDSDSPDDTIPLVDRSRYSYFATTRGLESVKHIICRARAKLLYSARAARVSWDCGLDEALEVTLRKNATLQDPRIAGGSATGKIVAYEMKGDGDSGEFIARITIACAVGNATAISLSAGTDDYADADYIVSGYYQLTGEVIEALPAGDVGFTPPVISSLGEMVFPLSAGQVLVREEVINSIEEQEAILSPGEIYRAGGVDTTLDPLEAHMKWQLEKLIAALKSKVQTYELEILPVTGGPFTRDYVIEPTILTIPKQIDLAAVG
jgi:hypothetical protein